MRVIVASLVMVGRPLDGLVTSLTWLSVSVSTGARVESTRPRADERRRDSRPCLANVRFLLRHLVGADSLIEHGTVHARRQVGRSEPVAFTPATTP